MSIGFRDKVLRTVKAEYLPLENLQEIPLKPPDCQKAKYHWTFEQIKNPPVDKNFFINRWYLICVSNTKLIQCKDLSGVCAFLSSGGLTGFIVQLQP